MGYAGRLQGTNEDTYEPPDDMATRLDDPRAADLLYDIAYRHEQVSSVTAAWQLAQLSDPRAADLLAAMAQDPDFPWYERQTLISALSGLDLGRAVELMNALADDPQLNKNAQRETKRFRAELSARLRPET